MTAATCALACAHMFTVPQLACAFASACACACLCAYVHCSHAHHIMDHRAFNRQQLDQVFVSSDFSWLSSPPAPYLHLCQTAFPLDWVQRGKEIDLLLPSKKE